MHQILTASLTLLVALGCASAPPTEQSAAEATPSTPVETNLPPESVAPTPETVPTPTQAENLYTSEQFGFQFRYPSGYVLTAQEEGATGGYISIMRQEDVGTPEPLSIYLDIQANPEQLSLEAFLDQEIQPLIQAQHPNTTVAGQPALDFESTGLYEMRNLLFSTPDGRYVIHLNVTYLGTPGEDDPLWQAAKAIADSFQWQD